MGEKWRRMTVAENRNEVRTMSDCPNATPTMPRPECPTPQFDRGEAARLLLNGTWAFHTDRDGTGEVRGLPTAPDAAFGETIIVPFCRESVLSGIGDTSYCEHVWYRRTVTLPAAWVGGRVRLCVGACDYRTRVWVNGQAVGEHRGGFVSFSFDITDALVAGENAITIGVDDCLRAEEQPCGKQAPDQSYGCFYTRTTGIWQTVWLEHMPAASIAHVRYVTDIDAPAVRMEVAVRGGEGMILTAAATYAGKAMGTASATVRGGRAVLEMPLAERHLWEVGHGRLYDVTLTLGEDTVRSYFGLRRVDCVDGMLRLSGPVFQRLVLDQGFYPDGIYTAPTAAALEADIDRALAMGFNGARLHQKVFEPYFLTLCDRKGYLVWGEHGNWGLDVSRPTAWRGFIPEWCEILERDINHPAIVGWCPLNETPDEQDQDLVRALATVTRQYDPTRVFIGTSGWTHVPGVSDMVDRHDYEQDPARFAENLDKAAAAGITFLSEYGGTLWAPTDDAAWGYGQAPLTEEEYLARLDGLTAAILAHPRMSGLCYTQLTDVEQEVNGLYTYDRRPKFDPARIRAIFGRPAAVETSTKR